ncbi:sugar isomerase domain-containing protein [bacterium]|nr:sugar isomerase domain-containing protein [bacterium]
MNAPRPIIDRYFEESERQLRAVYETQRAKLDLAAQWLGEALAADHWLYAFGTGHSHMLAEEIFYRAGNLGRANPILDDRLMMHKEAIEATYLERKQGLASEILAQYPVEAGDVLIVASNSGRNAVPIELAMVGREKGMKVIAITNMAQSLAWPSRHSSGIRLCDAAELAIDNCGINGDAAVYLNGLEGKVGPTSTITGAFIVNAIIVGGIEHALKLGHTPEVFISSNTNGDDHNDRILQKYKSRVRHL